MTKHIPEEQHNVEIHQNLEHWKKKPILQKVYAGFYNLIKQNVNEKLEGEVVELGSGVGNLKSVIPKAICTDLFDNPWVDQVENAYKLSFDNQKVSNIIMFDVFHHLEYPGDALDELFRVLKPGGRVVIFEPDMSLLGHMVYGLMHHEPVKPFSKISWKCPSKKDLLSLDYYAAQGNAHRVFLKNRYRKMMDGLRLIKIKRMAAISYIFTGGYSKPQMLPDRLFKFLFILDRLFSFLPFLFSTRLLVVLEKNS